MSKVVRHSCPICNKGFYRSSDCKVQNLFSTPLVEQFLWSLYSQYEYYAFFLKFPFWRCISARTQKPRNFHVKLVEKVFLMWATWTDISEFTQKRNLMCAPTVERDSTRPPHCKTTKKSTRPMSLASVLNVQRSSKLAEFCWNTYELFTSTQLKVLQRLVLQYIVVELWWAGLIANLHFDARLPAIVCCSRTRNMQTWWLPKLKKKCQPNAFTVRWHIMQ